MERCNREAFWAGSIAQRMRKPTTSVSAMAAKALRALDRFCEHHDDYDGCLVSYLDRSGVSPSSKTVARRRLVASGGESASDEVSVTECQTMPLDLEYRLRLRLLRQLLMLQLFHARDARALFSHDTRDNRLVDGRTRSKMTQKASLDPRVEMDGTIGTSGRRPWRVTVPVVALHPEK